MVVLFQTTKESSTAAVAQLAERRLPKPKVTGSNPACRSIKKQLSVLDSCFFCRISILQQLKKYLKLFYYA